MTLYFQYVITLSSKQGANDIADVQDTGEATNGPSWPLGRSTSCARRDRCTAARGSRGRRRRLRLPERRSSPSRFPEEDCVSLMLPGHRASLEGAAGTFCALLPNLASRARAQQGAGCRGRRCLRCSGCRRREPSHVVRRACAINRRAQPAGRSNHCPISSAPCRRETAHVPCW